MPKLKIEGGDEVAVPAPLIVRMAERLFRMGPARRPAHVEKARRRLASPHPSRNAAAVLLAAGETP
ncbi:MAG: hypothetical protein WB678_02170 [Stellaceae bacterium]